jgi:hypothetical protein
VGCRVSGMLWSVLCGGQWYGIFEVSGIFGVSGIFEVSGIFLRSAVYLRSVVCEINGEGRQ